MLKLWGRRNSVNVQKVLWLIGELGLSYENIPAGGSFGGLAEPAFRALNPNGLIPVLEDGGTAIWESHAILRYLAAQYGGHRFWDASPLARSVHDRWMDWCLSAWHPAFVTGVFWGYYRTPAADRDWPAIEASVRRCAELMAIVEGELRGHDYLTGVELGLGEIPLGTALYRYFELDIDRPALPRVEAWYDRLRRRPAYREHVMTPFDDLKGRLAF